MKATILHESNGRIRFRPSIKKMTLQDADILEAWFTQQPWCEDVKVHERTGTVTLYYQGPRQNILTAISGFSLRNLPIEIPQHSTRALNRDFKEKLVTKVLVKAGYTLFMPRPLCALRMVRHMIPFMKRGWQCLRHRELKVELLDALSIGISAVRGDFRTAGTVMFLLEVGELLEEWTRKKSVADLAQSMSLNVDRIWLRQSDGMDVLTPVSQVQLGDHVVIRTGSVIQLDGIVLEGEATFNQASLTGESIPVAKHPDSIVYAGTVVEEGECVVKVRCIAGQSRYEQIVTMIEQSEQLKSASEHKAANLADKLVPYTFAGSLLSLLLTRNTSRALSILMVDFSCALKLSIPLAVLSAMREASKAHMTVKGGKFLEAVAEADTIVFDKTGTLTYACPQVVDIVPFAGNDATEMLRLAACLEEHFPHSMANAVVNESNKRGLAHEEYHSKVDYLVAHGIASTIDNKRVLIGSSHFIFEDEHGIILPEDQAKFDALPSQYSHLYLTIGGVLSAVICIFDPLREEATAVLAALHELGIRQTVMLTGDSDRTAKAIAAEVGVDTYHAGMLPEEKARFVADLRKQGHTVLMIGDGINDSPALSEADAGIAISDGAAIAREIADITISANTLWEVISLLEISRGLQKRIKSNYRFVIGFNGTLITLGATGLLTPATSATLHNLSTLGVSLRSMSPLPRKGAHAFPACAR